MMIGCYVPALIQAFVKNLLNNKISAEMKMTPLVGRLRKEFDRLGIKPAAAAKLAGETDSQGVRDVLGGRKRLSADLLAGLDSAGVDVLYVLTGRRSALPPVALTVEEQVLLDRYRVSPTPLRDAALRVLLGGEASDQKQTQVFKGNVDLYIQAETLNQRGISFFAEKK